MLLTKKTANKIVALVVAAVLFLSSALSSALVGNGDARPFANFSNSIVMPGIQSLLQPGSLPRQPALPIIERVQGDVLVYRVSLSDNCGFLGESEIVRTGYNGIMHLAFDGANVTIAPNSHLKLVSSDTGNGTLDVELFVYEGNVFSYVYRPLAQNERFEVHTPATRAYVLGTAIHVSHSAEIGISEIGLLKGAIAVTCVASSQTVRHSVPAGMNGLLVRVSNDGSLDVSQTAVLEPNHIPAAVIASLLPGNTEINGLINESVQAVLLPTDYQISQDTPRDESIAEIILDNNMLNQDMLNLDHILDNLDFDLSQYDLIIPTTVLVDSGDSDDTADTELMTEPIEPPDQLEVYDTHEDEDEDVPEPENVPENESESQTEAEGTVPEVQPEPSLPPPDLIPPTEPETTDPTEPETTETEPETTDPTESETEPETTDPTAPETTDPTEPETTDPGCSIPQPTDPVDECYFEVLMLELISLADSRPIDFIIITENIQQLLEDYARAHMNGQIRELVLDILYLLHEQGFDGSNLGSPENRLIWHLVFILHNLPDIVDPTDPTDPELPIYTRRLLEFYEYDLRFIRLPHSTSGGFYRDVIFTNTSNRTLYNWSIEFDVGSGVYVLGANGASVRQVGNRVMILGNYALHPGESIWFELYGRRPGTIFSVEFTNIAVYSIERDYSSDNNYDNGGGGCGAINDDDTDDDEKIPDLVDEYPDYCPDDNDTNYELPCDDNLYEYRPDIDLNGQDNDSKECESDSDNVIYDYHVKENDPIGDVAKDEEDIINSDEDIVSDRDDSSHVVK